MLYLMIHLNITYTRLWCRYLLTNIYYVIRNTYIIWYGIGHSDFTVNEHNIIIMMQTNLVDNIFKVYSTLDICLYTFNDILYYYLLPTLICIPTRYIVIDMICVFCSRTIWTYAPCVYKFNIIIHNVIYCTHVYGCRTRVIGSVSNTSCGHLSFPHPRARRTSAADKTHVVRRWRVTDS